MVTKETKIGIFFAFFSIFLGGLQPVWANLRPIELDSHIFSGMSCLIQALIFMPIFLIERNYNSKNEDFINEKRDLEKQNRYKLFFGKSKWGLFIVIGTLFSIMMFLYYYGLTLAGSINGTLAVKTTAIFGLVFGFLLLKEEITKMQIVFSCVLFFGMIIAITQGAFYLLEVNLGVILILTCAAVWMFGHTCSKPYLVNKITTGSELLVMRNLISASVLIISYVIVFGPHVMIIFNPEYAYYYIIMGLIYGSNLFCWYKILQNLDVSIGTIVITPQLIVTAFFGSLLLNEPFTIYHLIGLIIIIFSIFMINYRPKSKE
ncbi:MAG: DMT family transporter [Promethearchaeota archaeon]